MKWVLFLCLLFQHCCYCNVVEDEHSIFHSVDTDGIVRLILSCLGLDVWRTLEVPQESK